MTTPTPKAASDTPLTDAVDWSRAEYPEVYAVMRDHAKELERRVAALEATMQQIADETQRHHEYNPVDKKSRLPRGYTTIMNLACAAMREAKP